MIGKTLNTNQIINTIRQTLSCQDQQIALHEPYFGGNEWCYVKECLDTGWVSSVGTFVNRFEDDLANFTGAKHAIATANGTSALHICFRLAGIEAGDEVLVPTLTFVGTVNAIAYCQATPHFIDAEENTLGVNADLLDDYLKDITKIAGTTTINRITNRPIKALCVMHTLGHPVDLDRMVEICDKYNLILIEDAAEAVGSYYKNAHVGHAGLLGILSFNGNKIMTTGGGGAILTDDPHIAKRAKHITTTAKVPHAWRFAHDELGYNYRLPNINAALGCAQLEQMNEFLRAKRELAAIYQHAFMGVQGVKLLKEPPFAKSNYWINALILDEPYANLRDQLLDEMISTGIMVRPLWELQHHLPMYSACPRMLLSIAEKLARRLIQIPSSPQLLNQINGVNKMALSI